MVRLPRPPRRFEVDPAPVPRLLLGSPTRPAAAGPTRAVPKITPPPVGRAPVPRTADPQPFRRWLGVR